MKRPLFILGCGLMLATGCGPSTSDVPSSAASYTSTTWRSPALAAPTDVAAPSHAAGAPNPLLASPPTDVAPFDAPLSDDYAAAVATAERENKPLLLIFAADWCEYCRRLQDEVLPHAAIRRLTADYVCVRINVGRRPDLCEQYRVRAYPTIVSASSRGAAWQRITGMQTVRSLSTQLAITPAAVAERRATQPEALTR